MVQRGSIYPHTDTDFVNLTEPSLVVDPEHTTLLSQLFADARGIQRIEIGQAEAAHYILAMLLALIVVGWWQQR